MIHSVLMLEKQPTSKEKRISRQAAPLLKYLKFVVEMFNILA